MKRTAFACLVLVLPLLAGACAEPQVAGPGAGGASVRPVDGGDEPPAEDPYLTGKVVSVSRIEPDGVGSIHIKGKPGAGGEPQAVASVARDIPVLRNTGAGAYETATFDDIAKGDRVSLWITGPVMESFPVQVSASFIVVQE